MHVLDIRCLFNYSHLYFSPLVDNRMGRDRDGVLDKITGDDIKDGLKNLRVQAHHLERSSAMHHLGPPFIHMMVLPLWFLAIDWIVLTVKLMDFCTKIIKTDPHSLFLIMINDLVCVPAYTKESAVYSQEISVWGSICSIQTVGQIAPCLIEDAPKPHFDQSNLHRPF